MSVLGHKPLNILFMGTPEFAVPTLAALIDSPHRIVAVYSQPPRPAHRGQKETPSPVHQLAAKHNIPVYTPTSLKSPETQAEFAAHKADAAIVAAYGLLLPKPILEAYPMGCINVHPSLLPRWRGAAPIQRTVMAGDRETGICIMKMDEGLDTGDVYLRKHFSVPDDMTAGALHDLLAQEAGPLVLKTLADIQDLTAAPQSSEGIAYAKKITKDEARIDWSRPASDIHNQIRGLNPFPGAYFTYRGENIKILTSQLVSGNGAPGTVLDNQLTIACGNGTALRPLIVQRPGKKPMSTVEMLRGYPIAAGTAL